MQTQVRNRNNDVREGGKIKTIRVDLLHNRFYYIPDKLMYDKTDVGVIR